MKFDHGAFYVGVWLVAIGLAFVLIPYALKISSAITGSGIFSSEIIDPYITVGIDVFIPLAIAGIVSFVWGFIRSENV